ncbi:MAG: hypothetical protein WCP22_01110 [Chlamydiota bacterium]
MTTAAMALITPAGFGQPNARLMPLPSGSPRTFSFPAPADPVISDDPTSAQPIGLGGAATGGDTVRLRIGLPQFAGPVDVYFALFAPSLDPRAILILGENSTLSPMPLGVTPWRTGVTEAVDEDLFGGVPVKDLSPARHDLYCAVAPAGSTQSYYLWQTSFTVSGLARLAVVLNGPGDLLSWMNAHISYGWPGWETDGSTMRTWRYLSPEEVYANGQGDCTAQSAFEKYLLGRNGYACRLLWLERARYSDHAVCYGEGPGGFYYLEHAFDAFKGIYGPFGSVQEIGAHMYGHLVQSDGHEDSYTLSHFDDVPYGVDWWEFHRLLSPL